MLAAYPCPSLVVHASMRFRPSTRALEDFPRNAFSPTDTDPRAGNLRNCGRKRSESIRLAETAARRPTVTSPKRDSKVHRKQVLRQTRRQNSFGAGRRKPFKELYGFKGRREP